MPPRTVKHTAVKLSIGASPLISASASGTTSGASARHSPHPDLHTLICTPQLSRIATHRCQALNGRQPAVLRKRQRYRL